MEIDDAGLRGMVALMKIRESVLRCRYGWVCVCELLARVSEEEDGVESWLESEVCRVERGELGRPAGGCAVKEDMFWVLVGLEMSVRVVLVDVVLQRASV